MNYNINMKEKMLFKSKQIGLETIKLLDELPNSVSSWAISRQIVRSSTSIGANYRAAYRAKSTADFVYKLKIVEEEADETIFWLEMMEESNLVNKERTYNLKNEVNEVLSIVVSSIKTLKGRK